MFNASIDWEHSIQTRRSVRSYQNRALEADHLEKLMTFQNHLEVPFEHEIDVQFFKADPTKKLYLSMASPPDNAAFLAETDILSITKVGFLGEMLILYANTLGISTCWYGHYHLEELERLMPHLPSPDALSTSNIGFGYSKNGLVEGRRAVCVTPLGYHNTNGLRLMDRATELFISHKRKPLEEILTVSPPVERFPEALQSALEMARLAPSAANSQHWRFEVSDDCRMVKIAMTPGYKHMKWEHPDVDVGICAAHFWVGLRLKGITPELNLSYKEGRAVWAFKW